jgi:hypothetical protein
LNDFRSIGVPAEGGESETGGKALWVIRELGLPAIVKACVSCSSTCHRPTGKFRVNANGKLLKVVIRFELPVPIRVEKLLATGFGLSRSAVRGMVDSGRIRLPMAIDAKAREDFTLFVIATPPPSRDATADQQAPPWAWRRRQPPRTCWRGVTARSRRTGVVLEMEQDRIVWDARLAKPLCSGGSLGKAHCYQGPHVTVRSDQIVDRATGSTLPLPTVTARCAERLNCSLHAQIAIFGASQHENH